MFLQTARRKISLEKTLVMGIINVTPDSFSDGGLHDAFRLFEQPPRSWSWWDYRQLAFQKGRGLRIDHILVSEALKPRVTACSIDRPTRKNPRPSDHAPVLVEIDWPPPGTEPLAG